MANTKNLIPRTEKVCLRVYPTVKAALIAEARRKGVTLTDYIEPLIVKALQRDGANLNVSVSLAELINAKRA